MSCANSFTVLGDFTDKILKLISRGEDSIINLGNIKAYIWEEEDEKDVFIVKVVTIDPDAEIVINEKSTEEDKEQLYLQMKKEMNMSDAKIYIKRNYRSRWDYFDLEKSEFSKDFPYEEAEEFLGRRAEMFLIRTPNRSIYYYPGGLDSNYMRGSKEVSISLHAFKRGTFNENGNNIAHFYQDMIRLFASIHIQPTPTQDVIRESIGRDVGSLVSSFINVV